MRQMNEWIYTWGQILIDGNEFARMIRGHIRQFCEETTALTKIWEHKPDGIFVKLPVTEPSGCHIGHRQRYEKDRIGEACISLWRVCSSILRTFNPVSHWCKKLCVLRLSWYLLPCGMLLRDRLCIKHIKGILKPSFLTLSEYHP